MAKSGGGGGRVTRKVDNTPLSKKIALDLYVKSANKLLAMQRAGKPIAGAWKSVVRRAVRQGVTYDDTKTVSDRIG